jgi:ubiquinol-cytochrome c reductase iron-sulfur subunit
VSTDATTEPTRRDFLYIATGMAGAVGVAAVAWPFIDQMQPDASTLALSSVEVDISSLQPGMSLTVKWRGKPVFIRNRTPDEIAKAKQVSLDDLKDPVARNANLPADAPATDPNRSGGAGEGSEPIAASAAAPAAASTGDAGKENWLIMVGVCTHLGCIPLGQQGDFGGWFCPCHGSQYDTAGRIRKGPAPENMAVPVFKFISDTKVRIG